MPVDVAIIGAGPAGSAAAVQCRRLGLSVTLIDSTGVAGGLIGNAWSIENEPATGGPIGGVEYVARMRRALALFDIGVVPGKVETIAPHFELHGKLPTVASRAVIVATGTRPQRAGIEGETTLAGGVLHYEVLPALVNKAESALVIGGGEAAFDYALSLAKAGATVVIAMRHTMHRANARLAAAVAACPHVSVLPDTVIEQLDALESGCQATGVAAGRRFESVVGKVVVAVGRVPVVPALDEALQTGLPGCSGPFASRGAAGQAEGALVATEKLTIAPGLYIAGDVRLGALGQSGIAVGDGLEAAQLAAAHIAGTRENQ